MKILRDKLITSALYINNSDIRLLIEKTLDKYDVLYMALNRAIYLYNNDYKQVDFYMEFLLRSQGSFLTDYDKNEMESVIMDLCNAVMKTNPDYHTVVANSTEDEIALTIINLPEIKKIIAVCLPFANPYPVALNLAKKLKGSSLTVDVKPIYSHISTFDTINKLKHSYKSFIDMCLNKPQQESLTETSYIDFSSVLISVLVNVIRGQENSVPLATFIMDSGKVFVKMYYISEYSKNKKTHNLSYKNFIKTQSLLNEKDLATIGSKILDLLNTANVINLTTIERTKAKKSPTQEVSINPAFSRESLAMLYNVSNFPMLTRPAPWILGDKGEPQGGGKQFNTLSDIDPLVSTKNFIYQVYNEDKSHKLNITNQALNIINEIQNIPFRIETNLLQYITENIDLLFSHESEITIQNFKGSTEFILSKDNKPKPPIYNIYHREYKKQLNHIRRILEILAMATVFKDQDLYFPAMLDFRGRLYLKSWPISPQEWYLGKFIIKMKNSTEEVHLDVKSSVIQILLGHLNDPFNKLQTTLLYKNITDKKTIDIYTDALTYLQNQLRIISPNILDVKDPQTKEIIINRTMVKKIIMKNLYSQTYSGLVEEFKHEYHYLAKEIKNILEEEGKIKDTQQVSPYNKKTYVKTVIEIENNTNFYTKKTEINEFHIIPSILTHYIKTNHPELVAYKKFFKVLAETNGDKPFNLTINEFITATQYYTLKKVTHIKAPFFSNQKVINIYEDTNPLEVDHKQTARATGVNFTHATDALIMFHTIKPLIEQGIAVVPTHDCFRISKEHIDKLNKAYANAYQKIIFDNDLLKKTYQNVFNNTEPENQKKLEKEWKVIQKYRELGAKHPKTYNDSILEIETKNHITVGFLDKYKK